MDEHTLNDLLECSVCLERLDTTAKVLPCQHTFCRKCLEVIVASRQELRCPECRVVVATKIDDLPPNVLLMRILEGMKNAAALKTQQKPTLGADGKKSNDCNTKADEKEITTEQFKLKRPAQESTISQQQQPLPQQVQLQHQRRCIVPHALALYDFTSTEPSDLKFKKGDMILLKRKLDTNWYVGQMYGVEGTFPINYVQVIVPLQTPQCVALYDFKMGPNEEEGCLAFKKGTIIHVLRRVDLNWAEGRIGANVGIFPIAFVELNPYAKQLLDSFLLPSQTPAAAAATAAGATSTTLKQNQNAQQPLQSNVQQQNLHQTQPQNQQQQSTNQIRTLPPIPLIDPTTNTNASDTATSSSASSTNVSPNSTTSSSSNSSHLPGNNSLNQSLPNTPQHSARNGVRYRDNREKRHSLNTLLSTGTTGAIPSLSVIQSNRHSAEILSVPTELSSTTVPPTSNTNSVHCLRTRNSNDDSGSQQMISSSLAAQQAVNAQQCHSNSGTTSAAPSRVNVLKLSTGQPPTLPWGYLALYPYKPRKSDELELKKGCVYIVTEYCLDGWFKGKNWQDVAGVFPGNYVTPLRNRDQQQLMHQWKLVPIQATQQKPPTPNPTLNQPQQLENLNPRLIVCLPHQPPDLPPRQMSSPPTVTSVWTKPIGQTVETLFSRSSSCVGGNKTENVTSVESNKETKEREKEAKQKELHNSITNNTSTKSAAVSLMKRLTNIKSRSKSPGNSTTPTSNVQQSNTTESQSIAFGDNCASPDGHPPGDVLANIIPTNSTTAQMQQPLHIRSGSCPSQLLQSLPIELATPSLNDAGHHKQAILHQQQLVSAQFIATYGSQRIKGNKDRSQLQNMRQSVDGSFARDIPQQQQQQHQQPHAANALTSITKSAQQQQRQSQTQSSQCQANIATNIINHRKTQSLDANTLIVPSNDSATTVKITTAMPSITAAAIAASATTKSAQNTRESRFRCIVPYPPNSDIELELHIGDIIFVHRKQKNGWYKGTHARTNKTGLFPASFVEPDI